MVSLNSLNSVTNYLSLKGLVPSTSCVRDQDNGVFPK